MAKHCGKEPHDYQQWEAIPLQDGGYRRLDECSSCKTVRILVFNKDGDPTHTSYRYPQEAETQPAGIKDE